MAITNPNSGFNPNTKIYHNLRPPVTLPPPPLPLSTTQYAFDILNKSLLSSPESVTALIDATTATSLSYSDFLRRAQSLSLSLHTQLGLKKGDVAFILSPSSLQVPILYFALLSLGVVVSPANPISTESEISRQISLTKPVIAFATSATSAKLPSFRYGTFLIDSNKFESMMKMKSTSMGMISQNVQQTDTAAILYSSGTTGRVKGVELTHRNFIGLLAGFDQIPVDTDKNRPHPIALFTVPLFHVYGFFMCIRALAFGETLVLMERFDFEGMLKVVQTYRVTFMPVSPPLVLAMAKLPVVDKYDLSSLNIVGCGGAPLGKEVSEKFSERFPNVQVNQGYGMTETASGATRMMGAEETKKHGSVGKLAENMEAKIVDPSTGEALPPGHRGELWLRGPIIMKGYVGDEEATASTMDPEGWLKTGDLCYIDSEGFLYIVDRLKELIKYKAYQVPPAELEHILHSHPEIADVAVVPYPDEEAGQIPMAFVVRKPGSNLTGAQVMDFVSKQVAPYKKIRRVSFISAIPKSAAGKTLRRELVDSAASFPSAKL